MLLIIWELAPAQALIALILLLRRRLAWSGVILSLCSMWMADVARKVCTRGRFAKRTASHAVSKSLHGRGNY